MQHVRHQVAIAGQVKNAVTGEGIAGAIVKLIDAPDAFMAFVVFKTKLLGLPVKPMQWRSFNSTLKTMSRDSPPVVQNIQEIVTNPKIRNGDKLESLQLILNDASVTNQHKFQAIQSILDRFPPSSKSDRLTLERSQTASDGWFYFTDLPDGSYHLEAILPNAGSRYSNAYANIELTQTNGSTNANPNSFFPDRLRLMFALKPTVLFGKITNVDDQEAIGMAKIQLQDSGEQTFSLGTISKHPLGDWNYRFVGIEPNDSLTTVSVSAKGYATQQQKIHLRPGEATSLDFQLVSQ